jgi:tRNA_anti-like
LRATRETKFSRSGRSDATNAANTAPWRTPRKTKISRSEHGSVAGSAGNNHLHSGSSDAADTRLPSRLLCERRGKYPPKLGEGAANLFSPTCVTGKNKSMNRKKIVLIVVLLAAAVAGYIGYTKFNEKPKETTDIKTSMEISATDLIKKFETNADSARAEFPGEKAIVVTGTVKEIKKDSLTGYTFMLGDTSSQSSVQCSIDNNSQEAAAKITAGSTVSLKGLIAGFQADDLGIGSSVILNKCILEVKK